MKLENENKSSGGVSVSESPARGCRTRREVPGATAVPDASSSALKLGSAQPSPVVTGELFRVSQPRGFPSSCPAASPPVGAQGTGSAHSAAMALAATRRPRGRLRSVMARTILGLDMVDTFTSSETCRGKGGTQIGSGQHGRDERQVAGLTPEPQGWPSRPRSARL